MVDETGARGSLNDMYSTLSMLQQGKARTAYYLPGLPMMLNVNALLLHFQILL